MGWWRRRNGAQPDANIRDAQVNPPPALIAKLPRLHTVAFK